MKIHLKVFNLIFIILLVLLIGCTNRNISNNKIKEKSNITDFSKTEDAINIIKEIINPSVGLTGKFALFLNDNLLGLFDFNKNILFKIPTNIDMYPNKDLNDLFSEKNIFIFSGKLNNQYDIFSLNIDNNEIQNLSNDMDCDDLNPLLSKNGEFVIFEKIKDKSKIFLLLNLNNKTIKPIYSSSDKNKNFKTFFCLDNKKILFFSGEEEGIAFIINIVDNTIESIINNEEKVLEIKLSPNGEKIAITSENKSRKEKNISIYNIKEKSLLRTSKIETYFNTAGLVWSYDSTKISWEALNNNSLTDIFIYDLVSNKTINITNTKQYKELGIKWSNKQDYVAWTRYEGDSWQDRVVCSYNLNTNHLFQFYFPDLEDPILNSSNHLWSPDGKNILFSYYKEGNGSYNISYCNKDGSNLKQLTNLYSSDARYFLWSFDGKWIAYFEVLRINAIDIAASPENEDNRVKLKIIDSINSKIIYEYSLYNYIDFKSLWIK